MAGRGLPVGGRGGLHQAGGGAGPPVKAVANKAVTQRKLPPPRRETGLAPAAGKLSSSRHPMRPPKVVITDHSFPGAAAERELVEGAGGILEIAQCRTEEDVIAACKGADALLVQWAPITERVLRALPGLRAVVRYGIGVDNVDVGAARLLGVAVANVPDYCIDEVADHTVALAVSLGRQLAATDRRLRAGNWRITPPSPMPPFREMSFVVVGLGRIGRAVLARAGAFGFRLAAHDPPSAGGVPGGGRPQPLPRRRVRRGRHPLAPRSPGGRHAPPGNHGEAPRHEANSAPHQHLPRGPRRHGGARRRAGRGPDRRGGPRRVRGGAASRPIRSCAAPAPSSPPTRPGTARQASFVFSAWRRRRPSARSWGNP